MHRKLLLICLLSTLLLPSLSVQATENPPLLLSQDWRWLKSDDPDFWWWGGEQAEPFEGCEGDRVESELILSPTQPMVAYLSTSEIWLPLMGKGWSGADFPNDLLICNLTTGEITAVAVQPENATLAEQGAWYYDSHSVPTWSPDGTQLAWTEYTGDDVLQLMVYDLATSDTKILVEDLNLDGIVSLPRRQRVYWSEVGIGVDNVKGFEVYDVDTGELFNTVTFPQYSQFQFWITYEGKSYISYNDTDNIWYLVDPLTGDSQVMPGLPELYSLTTPNGLALRYEENIPPPFNDITPPHRTPRWSVVDGSNIMPLDYEWQPFNNLISISPDGQSIAYAHDDRLWQWQAGKANIANGMEDFALDTVISLVWTPMAWRVGSLSE